MTHTTFKLTLNGNSTTWERGRERSFRLPILPGGRRWRRRRLEEEEVERREVDGGEIKVLWMSCGVNRVAQKDRFSFKRL